MTVTVFLLLFSLLDAVTGVEQKFVKYKTNLLLNVSPSGITANSDFLWKFNQSTNVVKFNSGQNPKLLYDATRAEFFQQNYSLLLKNMQHNDSGSYTAIVMGNKDFTAAEYQVRVLDPVSPVKLTINSVVSDVCNITVTCRTQDSLISKTFHCNNISCSLVSNPDNTATSSTLSVYVQQDDIICNHTNQVSSAEARIKCETTTTTANSAATAAGISVSVLLVAVIIGSIALYIYCKRKHRKNTVPESTSPDPNTYENPAEVASAASPSTTYSMVQFPKRLAQEEENKKDKPETVYAQINRVSKPD